jgi:signal transduction histidine kinase
VLILAISRPLAFVGLLSIFIAMPEATPAAMAIYAIAAAFFIATSAVINEWLPASPGTKVATFWAELAAAAALTLYTSLTYGSDAMQILYMPIISTVPMVIDRTGWRAAFGAVLAAWLLSTMPAYRQYESLHFMNLAVYGAAFLFFSSTGVLVRNLQDEQERSRELLKEVTESRAKLERANRQLRESAARQQEMAVLQERQRLAREIHDSVAHGLTALIVQTQAARRLLDRDPAAASETVARCEGMAREALQDTRQALRALHPSGLEQQSDLEALRRLARDFGLATGMQAEVTADAGALALAPDPNRLEQLYRIFQEALTNAHRHGNARSVSARLDLMDGRLSLLIANDGTTPEGLDPGVGLKSMRERAASLGGSVAFRPLAQGLQIQVWVPVKQEVAG